MDTILVSSYVSLFGLVSYYLVNYNCITTTSFRCDPPIKHGRACCLTDEDNKKSYRKARPLQTTHFHHELWFHEPIQMAKFGTTSSPSPEPGDIKTREPSQKSIPLEGPSRPKAQILGSRTEEHRLFIVKWAPPKNVPGDPNFPQGPARSRCASGVLCR